MKAVEKRMGKDTYLSFGFFNIPEDENFNPDALLDIPAFPLSKVNHKYFILGSNDIDSLGKATDVTYTLYNPTYFDIFKMCEDHYEKIGRPTTDHCLVEDFYKVKGKRNCYAIFVGS